MAPKKRSSVLPGDDGAGPSSSRPSKKPKSGTRFSESSAGGPSKREMELEALVTQLQAENQELRGKLSVAQQSSDANQTRSEIVGGDQYKVKILGTIGERVYTGSDVVGQDGELLKAVLYCNNQRVTWDPFASAEFEILVVRGDFRANDQKSWSAEEFEENLVKARKEVGLILTGVCRSKFSNGEKYLHGLKFKDNSSWADGKKWQLGVRVLGSYNVRILEAISEPFRVLDRHGKGSEKPHPPLLTSGVECLERVGHKRALILKNNRIHTVGHFWQRYREDKSDLLKILSITSEQDESWKAMIRHVKECNAGPNFYNHTRTSTDDDTSQSGQADVQDVNTNYIDSDARTANMDQLQHTETDADQNAGSDLSTVQHYNLIQDQTAGVQDIQVNVDTVLSDSDGQLPDTEADANHARPDYSLVQRFHLNQDETLIQEMEQEGSFGAIYYHVHTPVHENLSDIMEPCNDNGSLEVNLWSQDVLINATTHNSYSRPDSEAEDDQWIEETIVGNTLLSSLKGGIAAVCFLMRVMRRRRTG